MREARTLARLHHPNIVAIHDVEDVGGEVILVLEYLPRGNLAELLTKGRLTQAEVLLLAADVLGALQAAHARGIVHRDVKPANVLLTEEGRAKLADFGIAGRAVGTGTAEGLSLGSHGEGALAYMSPEQARGAAADARSDVYALGATLYEMLAGRAYLAVAGNRFLPCGSVRIAHGHPLGATGAALVMKLLYELERSGKRYGLSTMCIGFGQGIATVVERL